MKKIKVLWNIYKGAISILIPIVLFLSILEAYAFSPKFYLNEFQKQNTAERTGIGQSELEEIVYKVFRYLKGKDADLNMRISVMGNQMEAFGAREKRHMQDVRDLFKWGFWIRNIALLISVIFIIVLWKISSNIYRDILQICTMASLISMIMVLFLIILIGTDFYKSFVSFHRIFFYNDLWILVPETDLLIQLFTLEFFMNISSRVVLWFGALMGTTGLISHRLLYHIKRHNV